MIYDTTKATNRFSRYGRRPGRIGSGRHARRFMRYASFKYDVAFSFLKRDEALVFQVDSLLHGRVKTFVPSRRDEFIGHTDFENTARRVFGYETRIVTVLYRSHWGSTGRTLLEETVIRNRVHEDGYDFVLLVLLDTPPSLPLWIPKKQLWLSFDRWGLEGTAAVIEARVQQAGGGPTREETPLERAQRLEREQALEEERQAFLHSQDGFRSALSELAQLFDTIEWISNEIAKTARRIPVRIDRDEKHLVLSVHGLSLDVAWVLRSPNTLERSSLHVMLWKGLLPVHGAAFEKLRRLEKTEFSFDRNFEGENGWREPGREDRFLSSAELAEECLNLLLDHLPGGRWEE